MTSHGPGRIGRVCFVHHRLTLSILIVPLTATDSPHTSVFSTGWAQLHSDGTVWVEPGLSGERLWCPYSVVALGAVLAEEDAVAEEAEAYASVHLPLD